MAYLRELHTPKCVTCGKKAAVRLIDRWNGERGEYCKRHGEIACKRQASAEAGNDGRVASESSRG